MHESWTLSRKKMVRRSRTRRRTRRQRGHGVTTSKVQPSSWCLGADGDLHRLHETFQGRPFFRKEYPWPLEQKIAQRILENPHPHIVQIYRVGNTAMDMELLKPAKRMDPADVAGLEDAKRHLQRLGIAYIDWKLDNVGYGADGRLKVFDFNGSALNDEHPPVGYAWRQAIAAGRGQTPLSANNFVFQSFVKRDAGV